MTLLSALAGDPEVEALFTDAAELAALLRFESALAEAQGAAGLIPPEAAARIAEACATFAPDWPALRAGLARDGVVVPDLVRQLRAAVGEPYAKSLHRGATSQDVIDTGLVLRLAQLHPRLLKLQLGGPVGTRAELGEHGPAIAAHMAQRLGLADAPPWHGQRDTLVEFGALLALVAGSLGKIGQDVALMVQNELGTAKLAGGGTSSAMAHKSNPVPAELLVALARFTAGLSGTLAGALVHENERSGAAWTLEWLVLPPLAVSTGAALRTALNLVAHLSFPAKLA